MREFKIKSGFEDFDRDYPRLLEFLESDSPEELSRLSQAESLNMGDVFNLVDARVLSLARMIQDEPGFEFLVQNLSQEATEHLAEHRDKVVAVFRPLFESDAFKAASAAIASTQTPANERPGLAFKAMRPVTRLSAMSNWLVIEDKIQPAIRVQMGHESELLLDTTLDWDDAVFLCAGVLDGLQKDLKRVKRLTKAEDRANFSDEITSRIEKRLDEIESSVSDIREYLSATPQSN